MKPNIAVCACNRKDTDHCRLSPTCKGWGCRFLSTPIQELPTTEKERAVLFSKVYREAKEKGVIECPFFNSLQIDRYLEILENLQTFTDGIPEKMSENVSFANYIRIVNN